MEDKKLFYKDILQRDITILRTAANTLEALKHRWLHTQAIEGLGKELVNISETLLAEGWNGYVKKPTFDDLAMIEVGLAGELAKKMEEDRKMVEESALKAKLAAEEVAKQAKIAKLKEDLKELEVE